MDIPWDPTEPVDDEGDDKGGKGKGVAYDSQVRRTAELDMNDFTRRMEALALENAEDGEIEDDANVDRPWRDVE